jgi:magnesium transporter
LGALVDNLREVEPRVIQGCRCIIKEAHMIISYTQNGNGLAVLPPESDPANAVWIDLYRPLAEEVERVAALGLSVPSLADMEEIEISNRLYRVAGADYMTVVLPGQSPDKEQIIAPVTFILTRDRLVTVRHHAPRPFETFGARADKTATGCRRAGNIFLGLVEEILGRQADLLEGVGRALDDTSRLVFGDQTKQNPAMLQTALQKIGSQGELLSRVRLGLLTTERAVAYFSQTLDDTPESKPLRPHAKSRLRDLQSLEIHADFLSSRLSFATDATLGMVNLAQNMTVRIVSVVAVLFLPPTLIASAFGMNFVGMPGIGEPWGFAASLAAMVGSAAATYYFFKWKNWL